MRSITSLGLLLGSFFAVSGLGQRARCPLIIQQLSSPTVALAPLRKRAEDFEKAGKMAEAKDARLALAKATLQKRGIAWPVELADAVAKEVIWDTHAMAKDRAPGLRGALPYFRARLAPLRKHFSPLAAKELLRSGVAGDDAAFVNAIGSAPGDATPKLVYADYLEESGRRNAGRFLRLSVERERLVAGGEPADRARIAELETEMAPTTRLARAAVYDWFDMSVGEALTAAGTITMDPQSGLPLFRPHDLYALFSLHPTALDALVALDLTGFDIQNDTTRLRALRGLSLRHLQTLRIGGSGSYIGTSVGQWIATSLPALRSLTMLEFEAHGSHRSIQGVASGMQGAKLPHLFELRLQRSAGASAHWYVQVPEISAPQLLHLDIDAPLEAGATNFGGVLTPALKTLHIRNSALWPATRSQMLSWNLPELRSLHASASLVSGDLGWQRWRLPQLEELHLDSNDLDRDSLRSLARWNLPKLRRLSLRSAFNSEGEGQITTLTEELELGALRKLREVDGPEDTEEWRALRALLRSRP